MQSFEGSCACVCVCVCMINEFFAFEFLCYVYMTMRVMQSFEGSCVFVCVCVCDECIHCLRVPVLYVYDNICDAVI